METFCPSNRQEWRQWLQENHQSKPSIWLVQYKVKSGRPTISWSEAVDEALCFGWIDSTRKTLDQDTFIQFFCPRKPRSIWSKINKAKIERLIEEGLMAPAGLAIVEIAKKNGYWSILDEVEELIIPADLEKAFAEVPGSKDYFLSLSKSTRKIWLSHLVMAKQAATREKRIGEILELVGQELKSK